MAYTPNLIGKFPQGSLTAGNEIEAGLPNIIGSLYCASYIGSGSFSSSTESQWAIFAEWTPKDYHTIMERTVTFDASQCSSVYRNNFTTVQPPAVTVLYYIRAK